MGVLCRNHRGLLEAMSGSAKTGASVLFLNTDFAAPQLRDAIEREGVTTLLHDDEFTPLMNGVDLPRFTESDMDDLIATPTAPTACPVAARLHGDPHQRHVGTPEGRPARATTLPGAARRHPVQVRFRSGGAMFVGPPLFHGLGLTSALLALGLGSPLVLRRRFDASAVLDDLENTAAPRSSPYR